jgi:hypothetical protein
MKYIEVNGWGNKKKHLIPIKAIVDIAFEDQHTTIKLTNGNSVNIIEDEASIKGMLEYHNIDLIDEGQLDLIAAQQQVAYENMSKLYMDDDDELPF